MTKNLDKFKDIITDMNACELWYEGIEKEYRYKFGGKGLIIGVGNAGGNFLKRCIRDGFHSENPIMLLSCNEDEIGEEDISYSYLFKGDSVRLEQHLALYKSKCEGIPFTIIVGGLGRSSSVNIKRIAEVARKNGLIVIVVGYYPFRFESEEVKKRADSIIKDLRDNTVCEQLLVVDNGDTLFFVDKTALMPRLYAFIDEPIRGYIEYLSMKP